MSYCRFSDCDFQSDVYVYKHWSDGFVTHVANRRYLFSREGLPELDGTASATLRHYPYAHQQCSTSDQPAWSARYAPN